MSRTIARRVGPALVLLLLLGAWETGVRVGRVPAYLLPPPSRIVAVFFAELPALLPHAGATLLEIAAGLAGGVLGGIALALAIFYLPPLESALYPLVIASQVIPVFAVAPLLVVWLGYGLWAKAAVAALIVFFPVTVNALDGLRAAQSETLDVLRALGASEARLFRLVRAPGSLPWLFSGLKIGVTQSVVGATIGEWIGAQRGLGYLMIESNALLRIDLVFASILMLTLVGLLLFALVRIIERRALRWRTPEGGGREWRTEWRGRRSSSPWS